MHKTFRPAFVSLVIGLLTATCPSASIATTPAPLSCGDYNNDGACDTADYVLWRNGGPLQNEVHTPGVVDHHDYLQWRAGFGTTFSGGGANQRTAAGTVPEPSGVLLAAMGGLIWSAFFARYRAAPTAL